MDDISNLLYIIFIVISIIGGIWQNLNNQKGARENKPDPIGHERIPNIEKLEEERRSSEITSAARLQALKEKAQASYSSQKTKRTRKSLLNEEDEITEPSLGTAYVNAQNFDAKKAIIYSEILNPPYL